MKAVYVIRHAEKDSKTGELTEEGKIKARRLREKLPRLNVVIASDSPRTQETALLLTGTKAAVDTRAGFFNASPEQSATLNKQAESHPFGFTGALLDTTQLEKNVSEKARELITLIFETIDSLEPNGKGLIVSHDITIVPAANLLTHKSLTGPFKTFPYLGGYVVNENRKVRPLQF